MSIIYIGSSSLQYLITKCKAAFASASHTHAAATTSAAGLMSAADKTKLNGIATGANAYSHPTTTGNKHVPSGGASGQILRWSADGTAAWGADNNTTYSAATPSANGLMSAADKSKLDGMPAGGVQGPAGQSAYQAAQAGGYAGTQAKFYTDLAAIEGLADLDETLAGI